MPSYGFLDFENWGSLEGELKDRFMANAQWPLDRAALAALKDLGMSDAAVASYFRVEPADVAELRQDYGL